MVRNGSREGQGEEVRREMRGGKKWMEREAEKS